jgi:glyoxylase-like metal-dependent hydrolase (beta-lactamase superfamily II)
VKAARQNPVNVQVTNRIYGIPEAMLEITLLGTGSPIPDPNRAGPATLVRAGGQAFLVDCGRGVLQRAAAIGLAATGLSALLLTHLHSDHITDLGDVLITAGSPRSDPIPRRCRSSDRSGPPRWSGRR